MSGPFGSSQWMYQSAAGFYPFAIDQSLRFNDNDSAYLSRTPASAGNRKTWTWSGWVKRGNLGINGNLFASDTNNISSQHRLRFTSADKLDFFSYDGSNDYKIETSALFRDASAWYHVVAVYDTSNATSTDRMRLYVNGERITAFSTTRYPALNYDGILNNSISHNIGRWVTSGYTSEYFDGYLAEVNFIDGSALDPTSFGEFKSGVWVAKEYTGSYGTNGFHLEFANGASLGADTSGNTNDWTANNLAATDVLLDSPTGNNFAVLSPIDKASGFTLADGNLNVSYSTAAWNSIRGTVGVSSGKYYWEVKVNTSLGTNPQALLGIGNSAMPITGNVAATSNVVLYDSYSGNKFPGSVSYGATYTLNDVIGFALDMDAGTMTFYKNGVSQGTAATGLSGTWFPSLMVYGTASFTANFGQSAFAYTEPADHLPLSTASLPDPAIDPAQDDVPSDYFNTLLYTGDGTNARSITGVGFQPSWTWIKTRSTSDNHVLHDEVRGANKQLFSNSTDQEFTSTSLLQSFDSDGFTLGTDSAVNGSGRTFAAWNWLAANSTASNSNGSITSTVSANPTAGFSIVSWTGTGSSSTVGHGLNSTPELIINKNRSAAENWVVYSIAQPNGTQYLRLNQSTALTTDSSVFGAAPTSSVFTVGSNPEGNGNGNNHIAYCFHSVDAFSKITLFTGNGSTDGPFIYCGFKPAWFMLRRTDVGNWWQITDNIRNPYNVVDLRLSANVSDAEYTASGSNDFMDFLSNGVKIRGSNAAVNASGGTYLVVAFAENPFKYANAR